MLFDQRGCGRSRPLGSIKDNTTAHLVADLEYLRDALGIPAWIVFGGSWGSLLGLAYAQLFPERVLGLVLRGVFLGSRDEINAYVQGSHGVVPEAWDTFSGSIPRTERSDLLAAYARRILGEDSEIARLAARAWLDYERALMGEMPLVQMPDAVQMAKARLQMHYLTHDCFLAPGQLLAGVERLRHIPAAIVQGLAAAYCGKAASRLARGDLGAGARCRAWRPVASGGAGLHQCPGVGRRIHCRLVRDAGRYGRYRENR